MIGYEQNRLTLVRWCSVPRGKKARAVFHCACGAEKEFQYDNVRSGNTKSCGCLAREMAVQKRLDNIEKFAEPSLRHGHSRKGSETPTWRTWVAMIQRCTNSNRDNYPYYGGRGIEVCERWRSFDNFLADMGERPESMTLDRIDQDGNYEPINCRWSTKSEQMKNRRPFARKRRDSVAV